MTYWDWKKLIDKLIEAHEKSRNKYKSLRPN